MQRFIKIDGKVRTDITYPAGFMGEQAGPGKVPQAALLHWCGMVCLSGTIWGEGCIPDGIKEKVNISSCYLFLGLCTAINTNV